MFENFIKNLAFLIIHSHFVLSAVFDISSSSCVLHSCIYVTDKLHTKFMCHSVFCSRVFHSIRSSPNIWHGLQKVFIAFIIATIKFYNFILFHVNFLMWLSHPICGPTILHLFLSLQSYMCGCTYFISVWKCNLRANNNWHINLNTVYDVNAH